MWVNKYFFFIGYIHRDISLLGIWALLQYVTLYVSMMIHSKRITRNNRLASQSTISVPRYIKCDGKTKNKSTIAEKN